MTKYFSYIAIITKAGNERAAGLGAEISEWLEERGVLVSCQDNRVGSKTLELGEPPPDLILVLGGDGTMLSVARKADLDSIPMLGVNLGRVGFLADITPESWKKQLSSVLDGEYFFSRRLLLSYRVLRDYVQMSRGQAINELVVNRRGVARLNRFYISIDKACAQRLRADGVIVSTPTGSTAYNVSAGGPLVFPELDSFILTPVCPFLQNFYPVVLPGSSVLRVDIPDEGPSMYLTVDGQSGAELLPGDSLEIERAVNTLVVLGTHAEHFVTKLQECGFFNGGDES